MRHYYSPSTGGFYLEGVHKTIPVDAVEITAERHAEIINTTACRIEGDERGFPVPIIPPKQP